ncbi:MAG: NAD(P)/FAD-dependent oxidoreductase [Pseudomonadota bacterium]|jgi:flavin-dependent dehydrogenase
MSRSHYDVVIVGARCAGAATGLLLARQGARVLIVDHDQPGTDTMSTHALMRAGVMQLHRWGVLDAVRTSGAPPVRAASFIYGSESLTVDIRPAFGTDALYAPRRWALDSILARAASNAGAELRYGVSCRGVLRASDGRVAGVRLKTASGRLETVTAGVVVGADGRRSTLARLVDAPILATSRHASAVVYGYFDGLQNQGYRWYWDAGAAGGMIPTHGGQSCVFLSLPDSRASDLRHRSGADLVAAARALVPELAKDLGGASAPESLISFGGQVGRLRQASGPGWALVGDAGYFKDPISAHGISDALRDAEILAESIVAGRPDDYPRLRDALSMDLFHITDRMAAFDWTMDELKALHAKLNAAMKLEQDWIAAQPAPPTAVPPFAFPADAGPEWMSRVGRSGVQTAAQ